MSTLNQGGQRRDGRKAQALLQQYRKKPSVTRRNELVERYRDVVENIARSMALRLPRSVDVHDLEHAGMWGLMQAIENYCPDKCSEFFPFMRLRVRGAMLDELRALDYMPRLWRRRLRDREEAATRLRQEFKREPTDEELAEFLGVSVSRLRLQYLGTGSLVRVPRAGSGEDGLDGLESFADEGIEPVVEALGRQELLEKIKDSLQPIEWKVLRLHYLEGMSGKEVARRLRLSASRICQIRGRVVERLKIRLAAAP